MRAVLRRRLVLVAALVAAMTVPGGTASAHPPPASFKFYQIAYNNDIYVVDNRGVASHLQYDDWVFYGRPTPQPSPTQYVKYPWAPTIYAVTFWPEYWMWDTLNLELWQRAGFPAPRTAGFIEGTQYYQWSSSGELFAYTEADDISHKLTFAEWRDSRFQLATVVQAGFYQLNWRSDPNIVYQDFAAREATPVGFEEWRAEDYPTPQQVQRFFGDVFYQIDGEDTIYYTGPTVDDYPLTLEEWLLAGQPAPELVS